MGYRNLGGGSSGGDTVNFPAEQDVGIELRSRLEAIIGEATGGVAVSQGPTTVVTSQKPATEIVHTQIDLIHTQYADTGDEDAASDWANPGNIAGAEDGSYATLSEGLVLVQGTAFGTFVPLVDKTSMTITQVELLSYHETSGINLLASGLTIGYRVGAFPTPIVSLETINNNENHLTSPRVYDITSLGPDGLGGAWDWSDFGDIQATFNGTIVVDAGLTVYRVDAVKLRITASSTEAA